MLDRSAKLTRKEQPLRRRFSSCQTDRGTQPPAATETLNGYFFAPSAQGFDDPRIERLVGQRCKRNARMLGQELEQVKSPNPVAPVWWIGDAVDQVQYVAFRFNFSQPGSGSFKGTRRRR